MNTEIPDPLGRQPIEEAHEEIRKAYLTQHWLKVYVASQTMFQDKVATTYFLGKVDRWDGTELHLSGCCWDGNYPGDNILQPGEGPRNEVVVNITDELIGCFCYSLDVED